MPKAKLAEYKRKRDPKKTPEPFGGKKRGKKPIFVVQRHDARRLHYDFRLERNGALASWAVPKGPPLEPGQQHLAVHVEDHPIEYATFEGEIPKGQYGAGTVEIWDKGTYDLVEEKKDGGLTVQLHGKRLKGTYALVPAHLSGDEKNWLIIRKKDDSAPSATAGGQLPADARHAGRGRAPRRVDLRDQVGRLPDRGHGRGRRARAAYAQGPGLHAALRERLEGARQGAEDPGLRRRRRGLRARRGGPAELLRDAAGQARDADRLLRLRPARGRGRADRRPAPRGAAQAAREAARQAEPDRSVLRELRRRRRTVRGREPAGARGDPGQAPRLEVPPGQALTGMAEGQRARPAGVRDRRLHARQGQARSALSARSSWRRIRAASSTTSATSAPASTIARSTGCSRS